MFIEILMRLHTVISWASTFGTASIHPAEVLMSKTLKRCQLLGLRLFGLDLKVEREEGEKTICLHLGEQKVACTSFLKLHLNMFWR